MAEGLTVQAIDGGGGAVPDYPLDVGDRLENHFFLPWHHRRWLNSEMRLKGTPECRALYFDLICIAQDQSPVGTLPRDSEQLAKLVGVPESHFNALCAMDYGPLYRWTPCLCRAEVRLMHPTVLEMALEARARKEDNRARNEAANAKKRIQRLRGMVGGLHAKLAENDAAVSWMDGWLSDAGCRYRNAAWVERAIAAWSDHVFDIHRLPRRDSG